MKKFIKSHFLSFNLSFYLLALIFYLSTLASLSFIFFNPSTSHKKAVLANTLGPKKGLRWIDTQVDSTGLRDKPIVKRDAYSTHFKNPDGTVTALFTGFKQNYESSPGVWEPIDYSLEKSTDPRYDYQTKNGVGIYLSKNGSIAQKEGDMLLESGAPTLGLYNPGSNSFTKLNNLDNPKVVKDDANNSLVLDGKDVKLIVYAYDTGVREDLILENSTIVDNASYNDLLTLKAPITTTGNLTLNEQSPNTKYELTAEDALVLTDNDQTINFPFPQGHDSQDNPTAIRRFLIKEGDVWYLYTSVPANWLKKLSTSYPVTIDPDFAGNSADAQISGNNATYATAVSTSSTFTASASTMKVGKELVSSIYYVYRGFLKFDTSSIGDTEVINNTILKLIASAKSGDFNNYIYIRGYNWSASDPISAGNQETAYDGCGASQNSVTWKRMGDITLGTQYGADVDMFNAVSKTGSTYYCLYSSKEGTVPTASDIVTIYATETFVNYRPVLTVDYSPAAPAGNPPSNQTLTSITANWADASSTGAVGYKLSAYTDILRTVYVTGYNNLDVGDVTSYNITGLNLSSTTAYTYDVSSYDASTNTSPKGSSVNVPPAPVVADATNVKACSFTISWTDNGNGDCLNTGSANHLYDIATDSGFTSFVTGYNNILVSASGSSVSINIPPPATGDTTYYYRVRNTCNNLWEGPYSTTKSVTTPGGVCTSVSASADDAYEKNNNTTFSSSAGGIYMYASTTATNVYNGGFRFTNVAVPQGSTITSANIRLNVINTANDDPLVTIYGEAVDNAVSFITNADVTDRATTTASTAWSAISLGSGWVTSPDLASSVQEVVNRAGWANNNSLVVLIKGGSSAIRNFGVNSYDGGATYGAQLQITFTPPVPSIPTASAATNITGSSFSANWNSSNASTSYILDVSTDINFGVDTFVTGYNALNVGNVTTKSVTGLTAGNTYYYRARGTNSVGTSNNSSPITVALAASTPVASAATSVSESSFVANWGTASGATSYKLSVSTNSLCTSAFITSSSCGGGACQDYGVGNVTNYTISNGISANTPYYFCVKATNTAGDTPISNVITVNTAPPAPVAISPDNFNINQTTFMAKTNTSTEATSYKLSVSTASNCVGSYVTGCGGLSCDSINTGSSNTYYQVTSLTAGNTYYYCFQAVNSGGTSSKSNVITVVTKASTPTALEESVPTTSSFQANWNTVTGATGGYKLDVARNIEFTDFVPGYQNKQIDGEGTVSNSVTNLLGNTTNYYYRIRAVTPSGTSANSNTIIATTSTGCSASCNTGTGATTFSCSCTPPNGTDFISGGNLVIGAGTTTTLTSNDLVWEPGRSITVNGTIVINTGSSLIQGYPIYPDADGDGYPDSLTPTIHTSGPTPAGYKSPSQLTSYRTLDCDSTVNTAYANCGTNDTKKIFYTASTFTGGAILGLSGADTKCSTEATNYSIPGTFKAWLADGTGSPSTRITPAAYKYVNLDNTIIAYNYTDLTDGNALTTGIKNNPIGSTGSTSVWTNTATGGTATSTVNTCSSWASTSGSAGSGLTNTATAGWTANASTTCDTALPLYCVEQ